MDEEFLAVYYLLIHLSGEQSIYFDESLTTEQLQLRLNTGQLKLIVWFAYNYII